MTPEEFTKHIEEMEAKGYLELLLSPVAAWMVMSTLHLALRHPQFPQETRKAVTKFAQMLAEYFPPPLKELAAQGLDPQFDTPKPPGHVAWGIRHGSTITGAED